MKFLRKRKDRPSAVTGKYVTWKDEDYFVEDVEKQEQSWMAMLVLADDRTRENAPCWFAPCRELQTIRAIR